MIALNEVCAVHLVDLCRRSGFRAWETVVLAQTPDSWCRGTGHGSRRQTVTWCSDNFTSSAL
jgi:hypothetical protein